VNCLRAAAKRGEQVWGARTFGGRATAPEWQYVPVRRLALYIEESVERGTQWAVFEPNGEALWSTLRLAVQSLLMALFRQGALAGARPEQAFFVRCGRDTTTQDEIDRGSVNIEVGFAPLKPAEFVMFRIRLTVADG
jgi:phage tail sheath protein FI